MRDQSEATRDTAVLLADECVANAVRHGGGHFEMTVRRHPGTLRVEVVDESPRQPIALAALPDSERGRGVAIVSRLASRWGTEATNHDGKVVWFELSLD
jgi:anti-sigma regulatory factor (Ser/Thr protein kinase)